MCLPFASITAVWYRKPEGRDHVRFRTLSILLAAVSYASAAEPVALVGTVANTTDPNRVVSAPAQITFDKDATCVLKISSPLYGSGTCTLKRYDANTGEIEIASEAPLITIAWTGTAKAGTITGSYRTTSPYTPELPQRGSFQFAIQSGVERVLQISDVLTWDTLKSGDQEYLLIRDGDLVSVHNKDGSYAGRRVFLGKDGNPTFLIDDSDNASVYRDFKTNRVLTTWVKDGDTGYFVQPAYGVNVYLDRFQQRTGWSSIEANGQTIFAHEVAGGVELFDASAKSLGIRSGRTTGGQFYWTKSTGDVTEFLDQSFKPLGWYSIQKGGDVYYAHLRGQNKFTFYDASMHELRRQDGFWASFGRGVLIGLSGVGAGIQQAAAYQAAQRAQLTGGDSSNGASPTVAAYNSSTTEQSGFGSTSANDSRGNSYVTSSQQIGNLTFSNTYGSNGYTANSTTQRLGMFDYINGSSNNGSFVGSNQRVGNFDYTHLATPTRSWNGTSTHSGDFTFHNFMGPNGQTVSGSSVRVGDFIFTNIH